MGRGGRSAVTSDHILNAHTLRHNKWQRETEEKKIHSKKKKYFLYRFARIQVESIDNGTMCRVEYCDVITS